MGSRSNPNGTWAELLGRYRSAWGRAWRTRKQVSPPRRSYEMQFLPAALELQETPVSPQPRILMALLVAFAAIALLWALFGRIDVVAVAHGKIVPNDRTKIIQPIETAAVRAIHVRDGQRVKAGALLIQLDPTQANADAARVNSEILNARLQAARARALLAALDNRHSKPNPFDIQAKDSALLQRMPDVPVERLNEAQRLLDGQYDEFRARLATIGSEVSRREAELRSIRETVRKLESTVPIARQRALDYQNLVTKNFVSRHGYLDKEQARIEQEAELATGKIRIEELLAALQAARDQAAGLIAETRRIALDSLADGDQKAATWQQELIKAESRGKLMTLIAPVDGTVQQLAVHTVGGVVTPAQPLMMLVPDDHPIEVEAYVENRDIGFVRPGDTAVVKIETFPFTKYGTINARVTSVASDAIQDEKRGLVFTARVALEQSAIQLEQHTLKLSPGMAVSVEVKTAQRRVIEYFLAPLMQYRDESLRER